jgi:hypothetical protein
MNNFYHLLSQIAFKVLVPCFDCFPQRVKYTCPSVLRMDYKCNLVAHNALAAPFTQYRLEMFKYKKSWSQYLYMFQVSFELTRTGGQPWCTHLPRPSSWLHRCTFPFDIYIWLPDLLCIALLWVQVHQLFMSVWYIVTHDGSLCNKHRREIDNILAQFLAYIDLHPIRKSHHGIISLFIKYLQWRSGVKVVMNL